MSIDEKFEVSEARYYLEAYDKAKSRAQRLYESGRIESALRQIEYAATIAWHKPILSNFVDDELEALIKDCASKFINPVQLPKRNDETPRKRAVLYNGQIVDSGALTQQYLDFLLDQEIEVLFIVQDIRRAVAGKRILERLSKIGSVRVLILESGSRRKKIIQLQREIVNFDPDFSFLHFMPNDVVGCAAFAYLEGRPRYYIVHNDHTFWLGKGSADYFLEFRQLGVRVTIEWRMVPEERVVVLPYYPIHDKNPFQGFSFEHEGKIVGMSGGLLKKYFRDPELKYFHSIKNLLHKHLDWIFCLCGPATLKEIEWIKQFIEEHDLNGRFFYLGKRVDFYELVGHIDILFESYPQRGGLTVLFATEQQKAVVGIGSTKAYLGTTGQYLDIPDYEQPINFDEFEREASRLITDEGYRAENAKKFAEIRYNRCDFNAKLELIIKAGMEYQESLHFNQVIPDLNTSDWNILYHGGLSGQEFLLRSKVRAYVDSVLIARIIDVAFTLKDGGPAALFGRIRGLVNRVKFGKC